jgi:hypothetical protein
MHSHTRFGRWFNVAVSNRKHFLLKSKLQNQKLPQKKKQNEEFLFQRKQTINEN